MLLAVRFLLLTGALVAAVGAAGSLLAWPMLTATIGPTAYVFVASPGSEAARFRNAVLGHSIAIGAGVASLAVFGILHSPADGPGSGPTGLHVAASVLAVGVTMALLELLRSHHAPSAATALLVSTGLARPGAPLIGLVLGLAIVIAIGPFVGRLPLALKAARLEEIEGTVPLEVVRDR